MCGGFLSRSLDLDIERKAGPMNPNQMMIAKAMVSQEALREEARESRRRRDGDGRAGSERDRHDHNSLFGLLRRR
jgi:hypothetical protein